MMEQMLKYQEIDGKIKKIVYTLNHSDESVKGKKLGLFLKKAEENLKKMDRRSEELNSGVKKLKELYAQSIKDFDELEAGVEHAIDKNELNYISKKLADVSKNMAAIEKEISSVLREIDEIGKSYDDLKRKVPDARTQYKECRSKFEEKKKECEPEVTALKTELAQLEKEISDKNPKLIEIYQKLRGQNIFPVLVPLVGGNKCSGCQMEVSIGATSKLDEKGFVICENCQRLIYKA